MRKILKIKWGLVLLISLFLASLSAFALLTVGSEVVSDKSKVVYATTYGLYSSSMLVEKTNGKKFAQVPMKDAVIPAEHGEFGGKAGGGNGSGADSNYFAEQSDVDYYYNQGSIPLIDEDGNNITPDWRDTVRYLTFGYPEVFFQGYNGGCLGGEFLLEERIDSASYNAISVDVAYLWKREITAQDDTVGNYYLYVYGKDANGNAVYFNQAFEFGVNYWSTGVIEFTDEIVSVERIAVSIHHSSITNPNESGSYFYVANFKVLAKSGEEEIALKANDFDYKFYSGSAIGGQFNNVPNKGTESSPSVKVYRANNGYAAMGGFIGGSGKDGKNEYIYGTQRVVKGQYGIFLFDTPVKISEYSYFDLEMLIWPQVADGSYQMENTDEYTIGIYKYNTDDNGAPTDSFTIEKKEWSLCRINLSSLAENGYVSRFIIRYDSNSANRSAEEDQYYSLQMGFHDGMLTNKPVEDYNGVSMISERSKTERATVSLYENFDVNFKVKLGYGLINPVAKINYLNEEYELNDFSVQDDLTVFTFTEITAPYLTCKVKLKVYATNKNTGAFVNVSELNGFTVKEYCENVIFSDYEDYRAVEDISEERFDELQTLAVSVLNYGAAAQIYNNLYTDNLANKDIDGYQDKAMSFSEENLNERNVFKAQGKNIVSLCGAYLVLGRETSIRFKFKTEIGVDVKDLRFFVKESDNGFEEVSLNENGEIEINGIKTYEFDKKVCVKIETDGEISSYCEFSVNTYLARKYGKGESAELVKALYLYGVAMSACVD